MLASTFAHFVLPLAATMKDSLAWGLVLLCVVLGMLITLQPVRREKEVKGRLE
ncbi:hypothetical protein NG895_14885 [Aeoliella sp. ICT_H6.2]|uniref:Uncharacterized protein n=1 Tax=Aeoliella straminimaris TaxID=2954799 RepID=A0A9X2FA95_9BACT|nr:hypothetical protein [Aeoliella straminimaris]MCO6045195.1 hypothetical protein [Aeoliella straminimaris]